MSYNKFKIETLQSKLQLIVIKQAWLEDSPEPYKEDLLLMTWLAEISNIFLGSEKARSEFVVTPILQALNRRNKNKFSIFSGYEFNIDKEIELNGFCDFILSLKPDSLIVEAPAFFVVETKKTDIDDNAIAQCGAEMFAAQIFNERNGRPQKIMYGCVTSGFSWIFLKLENKTLSIDANNVPFTFKNPYPVLKTLQWVLDQSIFDSCES